jgi:hypothetical protein
MYHRSLRQWEEILHLESKAKNGQPSGLTICRYISVYEFVFREKFGRRSVSTEKLVLEDDVQSVL